MLQLGLFIILLFKLLADVTNVDVWRSDRGSGSSHVISLWKQRSAYVMLFYVVSLCVHSLQSWFVGSPRVLSNFIFHQLLCVFTEVFSNAISYFFIQGEPEFLGRCIAEPKIKLEDESYDPVLLEWHSVYKGTIAAGELLAGFELLEVGLKLHFLFMTSS